MGEYVSKIPHGCIFESTNYNTIVLDRSSNSFFRGKGNSPIIHAIKQRQSFIGSCDVLAAVQIFFPAKPPPLRDSLEQKNWQSWCGGS